MSSRTSPGSSNGVGASSRADRGQLQCKVDRLHTSQQQRISRALVTLSTRPDDCCHAAHG
jgi:hypothetical protein